MRSLLVLSALVYLAFATPSISRYGFEGLETFDKLPQISKREKKSSFEHHPTWHHPGVVIQPNINGNLPYGYDRTHLGLKKPIIFKKKIGIHGHHTYRDTDESKDEVKSQDKCTKQVTVNICDDKNGNQKAEENVKHNIQLAKDAVESLQRDLQNIKESGDLSNPQWQHGKSESDIKMHEDIEKAKFALQQIQQHFGEFTSINLLSKASNNSDVLQEVSFRVANTEEERLAQWKEAIASIQRNAEIAKNIEDSFRTSNIASKEVGILDVSSNENLEQESDFHQSLMKEDLSLKSLENLKPKGETKSTKRATTPSMMQPSKDMPEKMVNLAEKNDIVTELTGAASERIETKVAVSDSLKHEIESKSKNKHGWSAAARAEHVDVISSEKIPKLNVIDPQSQSSVNSVDSLFQKSKVPDDNQKLGDFDTSLKMKSAVPFSQNEIPKQVMESKKVTNNKPDGVIVDKPLIQIMKSAESVIPVTAVDITVDTNTKNAREKEQSTWKEANQNDASVSNSATILNEGNVGDDARSADITLSSKAADSVKEKNHADPANTLTQRMKPLEPMPRWNHEATKAASDIKTSVAMKAVEQPIITYQTQELLPPSQKSISGKSAAWNAEKAGEQPSITSQTKELMPSLQERITSGKSAGWKAEMPLERNSMMWKKTQTSARGAYGSYGSGSKALGIFPNAKVGGCAIPLLLSCNPSVVSGSLAKPHSYDSHVYAAPAYRNQDDVSKHNKRETIKANDVSSKSKEAPKTMTSKTSYILETNEKS